MLRFLPSLHAWAVGLGIAALLACAGALAVQAAADPKEDGRDQGGAPWTVDIEELTKENRHFRKAHWTGDQLQLTVMSLKPGEEIGLEMHEGLDQFIRIEAGAGRVVMGRAKDQLDFDRTVSDDWAILITAGYWHNVQNTGQEDLKLYSIYAPPEHPAGTLHRTPKDDPHHH